MVETTDRHQQLAPSDGLRLAQWGALRRRNAPFDFTFAAYFEYAPVQRGPADSAATGKLGHSMAGGMRSTPCFLLASTVDNGVQRDASGARLKPSVRLAEYFDGVGLA